MGSQDMNAIDEGMNPFLLKRELLEKYERTFFNSSNSYERRKGNTGFFAQRKK
jgi:hypothetical protein